VSTSDLELIPLDRRETLGGALASLETLRALPSQTVEKSKPITFSVEFDEVAAERRQRSPKRRRTIDAGAP
jgi:hypothetical protein